MDSRKQALAKSARTCTSNKVLGVSAQRFEWSPLSVKLKQIVSAERFELSTNGLKGHCSAVELRAHLAPRNARLRFIRCTGVACGTHFITHPRPETDTLLLINL